MNSYPIEFLNVSKSYSLNRLKYQTLSENFGQIFQRILTGKKRTLQTEDFWALKNISFKVGTDTVLGIIGRNGAGKTTILKLISQITYPDSGSIQVHGKVGAFIELGAGLHPELSGRENIYLYGSILGMKRKEINEKFPEIVKFSGIEKFLDTPIKKYSSGMYARIGFSVVAFMNPDIFLIDEVLAVGDQIFQERCIEKMRQLAKTKTIVFVSHNLDAVRDICTEVIYIESGRVKKWGKPKLVIDFYNNRARSEKYVL